MAPALRCRVLDRLVAYARLCTFAYSSEPCARSLEEQVHGARALREGHAAVTVKNARFCAALLPAELSNPEELVLAFRGATSTETLLVNLSPWESPLEPPLADARVHKGYLDHYSLVRAAVLEDAREYLARAPPGAKTRLTLAGHSLGGACAAIAALDLSVTLGADVHCVTFGAPPAGDAAFTREFDRRVSSSLRVVNPWDPAPHLDKVLGRAHVRGRVELPGAGLESGGLRHHHHIGTYLRNLDRARESRCCRVAPRASRAPEGRPARLPRG